MRILKRTMYDSCMTIFQNFTRFGQVPADAFFNPGVMADALSPELVPVYVDAVDAYAAASILPAARTFVLNTPNPLKRSYAIQTSDICWFRTPTFYQFSEPVPERFLLGSSSSGTALRTSSLDGQDEALAILTDYCPGGSIFFNVWVYFASTSILRAVAPLNEMGHPIWREARGSLPDQKGSEYLNLVGAARQCYDFVANSKRSIVRFNGAAKRARKGKSVLEDYTMCDETKA